MFKYIFWISSFVLLFSACNQQGASSGSIDFSTDAGGTSANSEAAEVIYALQLPIDIARIFEETGTNFNAELPIPLDRVQLHENPDQLALLLGVLGVDLSYCKLFERGIESAETYKYIELLADKLALPAEIFKKSSENLEIFVNQPDSLTILINQVYSEVESYFENNNQESLSSLSLLGGWLEAMYIGVRIYQDHSMIEMGDRILQQKFALNTLTGLLANHQESLVIRSYMHPLNKLKLLYEGVEITYSREGFEMDKQAQSFHASISEISYEPEILEEICQLILQTRSEIIL